MGKQPQPKRAEKASGVPPAKERSIDETGVTLAEPSVAPPATPTKPIIPSNYPVAVRTVYVLLLLYALPMALLAGYLLWIWKTKTTIDREHAIPRLILSLNIVGSQNPNASNIFNDLHKIILPLITFISGILAVATSQAKIRADLIKLVLALLTLTFVTYLLYLLRENQTSVAAAAQGGTYSAFSFLFSRTFESLTAYLMLLLGISIASNQEAEPAKPAKVAKAEPQGTVKVDGSRSSQGGK